MLRENTKKCYVKVAIIFYKSKKKKRNKKIIINTYLMYVKKKT